MSTHDENLVDGPDEVEARAHSDHAPGERLRYEDVDGTPQTATAGGAIISGQGDEVPDQTAGGLIVEGRGDLVDAETEGGEIIEGHGERVPQGADAPEGGLGERRHRPGGSHVEHLIDEVRHAGHHRDRD